jgi:DNA replication protein DnaC
MLSPPTLEKLHALKLAAMAAAWTAQQQDAAASQLSFDERFGFLVEAEWLARENARLTRSLQAAKLKLSQACVEAIDYPARRELDRALVRQLATGRWIAEHQHVLISGATGTGKTFVACALAHQACRQGYRALYWRVSRLFHELALARADGTYPRLLAKLARVDVLVLDDFALAPPRRPNAAISSRSWRTGTAPARRSSRANCRLRTGMSISGTRPSRMRSATACFTTCTGLWRGRSRLIRLFDEAVCVLVPCLTVLLPCLCGCGESVPSD